MAVIFFTIFLDMIGFGILIPVIPQLVANPSSPYYLLPASWSISDGYLLLGAMTSVYPLAVFLSSPIMGQLSDKYGRKRILSFALLGTCLSYLLFTIGIITRNIPILILSRIAHGLAGGNIAIAQAAIADISTPENRAKNFGMIGAAFGLGFILGPYLGGKLSDPTFVSWFTASTPFIFAAILCFLNMLSVMFFMPETNSHINKALQMTWNKSIKNILHAFTIKDLKSLFLTVFLFNAGFTFFVTFFSVFLINRFQFTQGNIGDYFAYIGICVAVTNAFVVRKVHSMFSDQTLLRFSIFGVAAIVLAHLFPREVWQLLILTPLFAIPNGITQAFITGLISKHAPANIQGEVLGINSSIMAIAQALPPILSGIIASKLGIDAPIMVASAVIFLAWVVFEVSHRQSAAKA